MTHAATHELIAFLEDVPATTARYDIRDDRGRSMDTIKVIGNPAGGYLAVYHVGVGDGLFEVAVATSDDLLTWAWRATLDRPASQPTVTALPDGGFLLVVEAGGGGEPAWLRFQRYDSLERLLTGAPDRVFDAPHTLVPPGRYAEGTPNIYPVLAPSVVDVGFHYFRRGRVDRQGRGRLVDFDRWTASAEPHLDAAIERFGVRGNIGGRDRFVWRDRPYLLIEGQHRRRVWQSWRTFLYDPSTGTAHPLAIRTHAGSTAFANPRVTALTTPAGEPALVVGLYLFHAGAAPGEGGPLLYVRPIPT
ncbi:hypothetical protein ACFY3U_08170 [Micromonospora sp. NPDC000089]|uniref:hypothetical protein n=1 Tax=unclassified Micromonospora TaxID=2617518 RepID=UPI0036AA5424